MKSKENICPLIIRTLVVTYFLLSTVNCSFRNNIENRKRVVEKRNAKEAKDHTPFKPKNGLKLALSEAMDASSNDDFDVIDVMYAVAKTFKDQQYSPVQKSDNADRTTDYVKKKTKRRPRKKRSSYQFDANDSISGFKYNNVGNEEYKNSSNVPLQPDDNLRQKYDNLYKNIFSTPRGESRRANLFNVPVDDQFLGFLAIPTNQAIAELALKQLEWIAFLFVSHIFDTNAGGEEEEENPTLLG